MYKPDELKGKTFKKNLGGSYNASEVDDFLAQLIDDYTKIYTDNAELQLKLEMLAERLTAYKKEEQKLKVAVANVKLLCDSLIKEANEKSEKMVKDAAAERDSIVNALSETVADKRREITSLNNAVAEYKESLLFKYKLHYDSITSLPLFDAESSEKLVADAEEKIEKLKNETHEIPVLLDEKKDEGEERAETEEVAEFIEPAEPVRETPQQIIKARVIKRADDDTVEFTSVPTAAEKADEQPTAVFDRPVTAVVSEPEAAEDGVPEEQISIDEVEEIEKSRPTEEVLANFAPKEQVSEPAAEEKEPEQEDEIDAPAFLNKKKKDALALDPEDKKSFIENIKIALAEKEEAERKQLEKEQEEQADFESVAERAKPIDDVEEEEEEIVSKFKDDIRFGDDFDDDDEDDEDGGFFSFFKTKK